WLDEEVGYIITPEERAAFKHLRTDDEREQFIQQFWERRNPYPGSPENKFEEEYYRRIVFANQSFSCTIPGWKTDRGHIYIQYGPPDEIDSHPIGGILSYGPKYPAESRTLAYPFERWRYGYMEKIGKDVILAFVDPANSGEYRLTFGPGQDYNPAAAGPSVEPSKRIDVHAEPSNPTPADFADLRAVMTSGLALPNPVALLLRTFHFPATELTGLTLVTIQVANRDLLFQSQGEAPHASVEIYGQFEAPSG